MILGKKISKIGADCKKLNFLNITIMKKTHKFFDSINKELFGMRAANEKPFCNDIVVIPFSFYLFTNFYCIFDVQFQIFLQSSERLGGGEEFSCQRCELFNSTRFK